MRVPSCIILVTYLKKKVVSKPVDTLFYFEEICVDTQSLFPLETVGPYTQYNIHVYSLPTYIHLGALFCTV